MFIDSLVIHNNAMVKNKAHLTHTPQLHNYCCEYLCVENVITPPGAYLSK